MPVQWQGSACLFPAFKEVFEEVDGAGRSGNGRRVFRNTGGGMQWCTRFAPLRLCSSAGVLKDGEHHRVQARGRNRPRNRCFMC